MRDLKSDLKLQEKNCLNKNIYIFAIICLSCKSISFKVFKEGILFNFTFEAFYNTQRTTKAILSVNFSLFIGSFFTSFI